MGKFRVGSHTQQNRTHSHANKNAAMVVYCMCFSKEVQHSSLLHTHQLPSVCSLISFICFASLCLSKQKVGKSHSCVYSLFLVIVLGSTHLDGALQLWLLITEPHHPNNCHGNAEPIEETEEIYDGEDVIGEGVEQRHETLEKAREEQLE